MFYKNIIAFAADMTADSSGGAARKGAEATQEKMERDELEIQEDLGPQGQSDVADTDIMHLIDPERAKSSDAMQVPFKDVK